MQKGLKFVGMRGFVMTTKQISINNMNINTRERKNEEFRNVFEHLKNAPRLSVEYKKRMYYLYFVKEFENNIIQCKLCRQTTIKIHDLGDKDINETISDDYPYINIFVHIPSQKFLMEINQGVFGEYSTAKTILEQAISRFMSHNDCYLSLQTITDNKSFWGFIDRSYKIYEVEFVLKAPNLFGVNDSADDFVRTVEEATNAKAISMKLANAEGNLSITKDNIDPYVNFANAGGGSWSIKRATRDGGKKETVKSGDRAITVNINVTQQNIKNGDVNINYIVGSFNNIEQLNEFRIGDEE